MPHITANGIEQHYEVAGSGPALVFIHGAFVDMALWDHQVAHFSDRFQVVRYDLRGHGQTEPTDAPTYTLELFADDLKALLDALGIERAIVCGLSLGGMIAQAFAVKHSAMLDRLILCDTAVSVTLTLSDKLQTYVLYPKWMIHLSIRLMSVERFTRFSFWLAAFSRSDDWFGKNAKTRDYVKSRMLAMSEAAYLRVYDAIYGFRQYDLATISAPTLILNGEHESRTVFRHTEEILRLIPNATAQVIPNAGHTSNMENAPAFNAALDRFLAGDT